jgi:spore germination cell wall hydrolase CwlJ-like protein
MITGMMIFAATIMMEAEGEPYAGKVMVAEVAVNQAHVRNKTIAKTCRIPKLFSCWNGKTIRQVSQKIAKWEKQPNNQAWKDCKIIASEICKPGYETATKSTNYYNPAKCNPYWAKSMQVCASVGNHLFLKSP